MEKRSIPICGRCNVRMKEIDITFSYLGKAFKHKVMRCPKCGQAYIDESLANGRMKDVEKMMEEK